MMRKIKSIICVFVLATTLIAMLSGCGEKAPVFSAETSIYYSAGDSKEWAYGNQQKEFPGDENCYVRVNSVLTSDIKEGMDTEISVTYRFTYTGDFHIELADGIASEAKNVGDGVIEVTRTILAQKARKANDDIVIFQYVPHGSGSVVIEVIYDEQVDARYDQRNTVYFSGNAADVEAGIH